MGTPQPIERTQDPVWAVPPRPERPDVVVVGEAEEAPSRTTLDDLQAEALADEELAARIAPVLEALDRGMERTRKEGEAEARRIVAAARDEAARIRKGIEDELVAAHMGLEQLRTRRDEVIQHLRELHDLVASTSERLAPEVTEDPETDLPPPPGSA